MKRDNKKSRMQNLLLAFCFSIAIPAQVQTGVEAAALNSPATPAEKLASATAISEGSTARSSGTEEVSLSDDDFEEPDEAGIWSPLHGLINRSGSSKCSDYVRIDPGETKLLIGSVDISDGDPVINS